MTEYYIMKETDRSNFFRPKAIISLNDYQLCISKNPNTTWFENTNHGKEILKSYKFQLKRRAYVNYNENSSENFCHLLWSKYGYITVVFENQIFDEDMIVIKQIADTLDAGMLKYTIEEE